MNARRGAEALGRVAVAERPGAPSGAEIGGPSLGVVVTVFHRLQFYEDALASVARQLGPLPRVEVVIVRTPELEIAIPPTLVERGWRCEVVRSEAIGEGPFFADGVTALGTDYVVPLDDDDRWAPDRLRRVAGALREHPDAAFYHNGQTFIDGAGGPIDAGAARRHLRRFGGVPDGPIREVSGDQLRRSPSQLARWGSFFNNSSVAVRRSVLIEAGAELRATPRMLDSFIFYAGASSGGSLLFDPAPSTEYRIHASNRSRGSSELASPQAPHSFPTRGGRMASIESMRAMTRRRGVAWLAVWLDRDRAYLDLLEGFREGEPRRGTTFVRAVRLIRHGRYSDPLMNVVLALTAAGLFAAPARVHRAYWGGTPPKVAAAAGPGSREPPAA
ncbi:MAG TPA: glycosyltransferase [Thermoplasmata archaeon]|nr:glycosyltransferase [Thermoplasmata archaeon]